MARISFDRVVTSCKFSGAFLRVSFLLLKEWFFLGILRLYYRIDVNQELDLVAIAQRFETDRSALEEQNQFPYKFDDEMLSVLNGANPLKRVLPDGTDDWRVGCEELCSIYRKKYECQGLTKKFAQGA